ncbi:ABC transporter ATP-binding protein [Candidatus Magnetaquicoccus inordinatus]|uniref:ABC transporter ATP-binding protein n=1 Tax=Candidatus Magnetaquicoccus inordinatus TaxID=2496818 RepID=UPI00102CFFF8|nr:ABC transporter ATP-binding protein [Candidatus Magnetaquicoccus inordinatus]
MQETMIEITGLSRFYGPTKALDAISLQVQRGEVMGFLGPNGAGKTTAMRILAGILSPSEGSVRIAGLDMIANPVEARAKIGFLPESPPIYGEMTVREYLHYLAALRRVDADHLSSAVAQAMDRCGLTHVADRLLRNLSKGYQQRAGIAQAIVHSPEVVILDEPTVGLDPIQIREIRQLIRDLGGEHSVLLSTHILPEVRMTCNRVAVINQGRIVADDTLEGLEQKAASKAAFFMRWLCPPDLAVLQNIPGVAQVRAKEGGWMITPIADQDPIPELLQQSVAQGWDLRELLPASNSLEEIFLHLTTREEDSLSPVNSQEESV